jgi:hypothetical protein
MIIEVAVLERLDIGKGCQNDGKAYAYIVTAIEGEHEMILGWPWSWYEDAIMDPKTR